MDVDNTDDPSYEPEDASSDEEGCKESMVVCYHKIIPEIFYYVYCFVEIVMQPDSDRNVNILEDTKWIIFQSSILQLFRDVCSLLTPSYFL